MDHEPHLAAHAGRDGLAPCGEIPLAAFPASGPSPARTALMNAHATNDFHAAYRCASGVHCWRYVFLIFGIALPFGSSRYQ
jgi:hypothetical protein